jgi:hypothetical protein
MKYQLVLQFRAKRTQDFDELIVLEDLLIENLLATSEVDGHDFGSDEFNIFVLTNQPRESFREAEKIIEQHHPRQQLKAAYRELGKEEFVILWPPNLQEFKNRLKDGIAGGLTEPLSQSKSKRAGTPRVRPFFSLHAAELVKSECQT